MEICFYIINPFFYEECVRIIAKFSLRSKEGMNMNYQQIANDLRNLTTNLKTKDVDRYNRQLIREKADVSDLKTYVLQDQLVYRTYFQVSLGQMKDYRTQFQFVEENADLLQDWWHVDQLLQFIRRPVPFEYAFQKAQQYIQSTKPFVRRWGYVLFLLGFQKEKEYTEVILSLLKNDDAYYVQMAEAWLICDLAVYHIEAVKTYLSSSNLSYRILGRAIQKCCDSYRIKEEDKTYLKSLRNKLKENEK